MGILGRKHSDGSTGSSNGGANAHGGHVPKVKITSEDEKHFKFRSENVHDPILDAVNEAQPFEQQQNVNHQRMSSLNMLGGMKDIFGNPISQPDISNPTRSRDERPMDTIRSFEYAITGDPMFRDQIETPHLGWRLRSAHMYANPDYDTNNNTTTTATHNYGYSDQPQGGQQQQQQYQQAIYTAPAPKVEEKKKRGLFGRKK